MGEIGCFRILDEIQF